MSASSAKTFLQRRLLHKYDKIQAIVDFVYRNTAAVPRGLLDIVFVAALPLFYLKIFNRRQLSTLLLSNFLHQQPTWFPQFPQFPYRTQLCSSDNSTVRRAPQGSSIPSPAPTLSNLLLPRLTSRPPGTAPLSIRLKRSADGSRPRLFAAS